MNTYDNPVRVSYRFAAATQAGGAAVLGRVQGPAGKAGRVASLTYVVTTSVTVAANTITIDTNAGITTPVSMTVPIATAPAGGSATKAALLAQTELPADTLVEVQSAGASTAGAADINLAIDWF